MSEPTTTLTDARRVLTAGSTLGDPEARREAGTFVLDHDPTPDAVRAVLDAIVSGPSRVGAGGGRATLVVARFLLADVLVGGVLRHHPRADIVPLVAERLHALLASPRWREREGVAVWMVEALSFVLARRALDVRRPLIERLWLDELGDSGRVLLEKWGDDELKAKAARST